eukprot:Hpha_TRINITY_DN18064_c0_g1::TRINITY_DN18064_c0_g1_i1::g.1182::m.1182
MEGVDDRVRNRGEEEAVGGQPPAKRRRDEGEEEEGGDHIQAVADKQGTAVRARTREAVESQKRAEAFMSDIELTLKRFTARGRRLRELTVADESVGLGVKKHSESIAGTVVPLLTEDEHQLARTFP